MYVTCLLTGGEGGEGGPHLHPPRIYAYLLPTLPEKEFIDWIIIKLFFKGPDSSKQSYDIWNCNRLTCERIYAFKRWNFPPKKLAND